MHTDTHLRIGIIILTWNGRQHTLDCLADLEKLDAHGIEWLPIVVDNASKDGTPEAVYHRFPEVTVIVNSDNLGYAGGNNVGITQAMARDCDAVILLNNDTVVPKDSLETLVRNARLRDFQVASPKIYFTKGHEFHDVYKEDEVGRVIWYAGGRIDWANVICQHIGVDEVDLGQHDISQETEFATGCCMYIAKEVIGAMGVLPEVYRAYYEDVEYCVRAAKAGFRVGYVAESHLYHHNAGATGGSGSPLQHAIQTKSRKTFALRNAPWRAKLAVLRYLR